MLTRYGSSLILRYSVRVFRAIVPEQSYLVVVYLLSLLSTRSIGYTWLATSLCMTQRQEARVTALA